jgi:predicted nuclease of restriction endonuclease-like (RecB) superfamily
MDEITTPDYQTFVASVKVRIQDAQLRALRSVNKELIELYWEIGKLIVEKQTALGWGKSVVDNLANDLKHEFPDIRGFPTSNLWRMRTFFAEYQEYTNLAPLVREIGWSHNLAIMEKCKDMQEREFYLRTVRKFGWSKSVLIHQIEGKAYGKYLLNQTNFDDTLPAKYISQAKWAVKDEYNFEFLEIGDAHSERELEEKLIANVRRFLLELGSDFTFIGTQFRLVVAGDEFFIDLLLFHRRLRSLIAVELKTTKFSPEAAGKMQFYLTALDETVKTEDENPSIGIIICKEKNRTVVEYTLRKLQSPMGVATYTVQGSLPEGYEQFLPSPDEIARRLENLND